MKFTRIALVGLGLGAILLLYIAIFRNTAPHGYLSWDPPGFAYINNQIVLDVATNLFNPTGRKIRSPSLRFPGIGGMEAQTVPITTVFNIHEETFEGITVDVDTLEEATASTAESVKITNKYESFWAYMYTRFIVYIFIVGGRWRTAAHDVMQKYRFSPDSPITHCVNVAMEQYPIAKSIGIHLRTWDKSVSLAGAHECETIYAYNPLKLFWQCRMKTDLLDRFIKSISYDDPVFITTDNIHSEVISDLKARHPQRNIFVLDYTKLLDECVKEEKDVFTRKWMSVHGLALIDSELLARTNVFVGNVFSTMSDIVALKRADQSYFLQNTAQYLLEQYLFYWIAIALAIPIAACVLLWRRRRRVEYMAVGKDDVELSPMPSTDSIS